MIAILKVNYIDSGLNLEAFGELTKPEHLEGQQVDQKPLLHAWRIRDAKNGRERKDEKEILSGDKTKVKAAC